MHFAARLPWLLRTHSTGAGVRTTPACSPAHGPAPCSSTGGSAPEGCLGQETPSCHNQDKTAVSCPAQVWLESLTSWPLLPSLLFSFFLQGHQGHLSGQETDVLGERGAHQDKLMEAEEQEGCHNCILGTFPTRQMYHLCTCVLLVPGLDLNPWTGFLRQSPPFPATTVPSPPFLQGHAAP